MVDLACYDVLGTCSWYRQGAGLPSLGKGLYDTQGISMAGKMH
jgi:hypothetical protein